MRRRHVWLGILAWRLAARLPGGRWGRLGRSLVGLGNRLVVIEVDGHRV